MQKRSIRSLAVIFLLLFSLLYSMFNTKYWKQEGQVIKWDVLEYYGYLPASFIYGDISLRFTDTPTENWGKKFWALTAPNGKKVFKMSMGMAVLYAPFFGLAHLYAHFSGYTADGFSAPYKFALLMSSLFYLFWGLWFLRKILLLYFSDTLTAITLLFIVAGTNLWYYGSLEAPLSHAYSFSLITIFLWLTIQWHKNPSTWTSAILGLITGMISLIRPSNAIIVVIFMLWGSGLSPRMLSARAGLFWKNKLNILIIAACSVLVWIPQMMYWKMQTGSWLYFSYAENGAFYFSHPEIVNGLFSYRKGWLIYTPIMIFTIPGLLLLFREHRESAWAITMFMLLNLYIIFSWWCWWYGGCFGQRAMIDSYGILALPLALFMKWAIRQTLWKKITLFGIIFLFAILSMFYTAQYYYGAIHWDSMTKKTYWDSFGRLHPGPGFLKSLKAPDYEKALKGEKEYP